LGYIINLSNKEFGGTNCITVNVTVGSNVASGKMLPSDSK
jgi:hypothetical protein